MINYFDIPIPKAKKPENYTYKERRAEILKLMIEGGQPNCISQIELAKRYGVSQPQISHDIKAIAESMKKNNENMIILMSEVGYRNSIKKLQEQGKYYKAARVLSLWNDWLFNSGRMKKAPEKFEHDIKSIDFNDFRRAFELAEEEDKGKKDKAISKEST